MNSLNYVQCLFIHTQSQIFVLPRGLAFHCLTQNQGTCLTWQHIAKTPSPIQKINKSKRQRKPGNPCSK
ncbi:hypothetical protein EP47_02270 [Legionella norrlandica]|uniref:Uncharacterized protein n=1 Tax=Legionella norrlandica TaxID=1498499 RepID=A0A0A2SVH8_9GAMM|nr:hypothetical protein EP47_02270 [Legionella norrlandica]